MVLQLGFGGNIVPPPLPPQLTWCGKKGRGASSNRSEVSRGSGVSGIQSSVSRVSVRQTNSSLNKMLSMEGGKVMAGDGASATVATDGAGRRSVRSSRGGRKNSLTFEEPL